MSNSLIPVTLSGPPTIRYGFWYSQGFSGLPKGHLLTLSTFWFTVVNLALGALIAWSVSTLWRITCAIMFGVFYRDQLTWEESQNMALIVNSRSALDACITSGGLLIRRRKVRASPQRSRANTTLVALTVLGFLVIGLNLGFPTLIALIPTTSTGLIVPHECGSVPAGPDGVANNEMVGKMSKWANAAFGTQGGNGSHSVTGSQKPSVSFPKITPSYVDSCPGNVSVCSTTHPFTFSTNYTLSREHFALNVDIPFSLQVFDTCYRPVQATRQLSNGTNPDATPVGIFYGPLTWGTDVQEYTEMSFQQRRYFGGYTLSQYAALANANQTGLWTPNSTLVMGGDTTLLLYYVGAVAMMGQSSDPIFATDPNPIGTNPEMYRSPNVVVPIICDTKYVLCADGRDDCSSPGGLYSMLDWMAVKNYNKWKDLAAIFGASLTFTPIYQASLGSVAIAALETTNTGVIQYDPDHCTVVRELGRLVNTSMLMIAAYGQLSALGYWNLGNGSTGLDRNSPKSICKNVIMDSSRVNTIPVVPYTVLLVSLLLIVLAGKIEIFPQKRMSPVYRNLINAWTLHLPGQLHREVTERIRGRFGKINTTVDWPTVETYHLGPAVVTEDDTKRFGSVGDSHKPSINNVSPTSTLLKSPSDFAPQYPATTFVSPSDATTPVAPGWSGPSYPQNYFDPSTAAAPGTASLSYRTSVAHNVTPQIHRNGDWDSERTQLIVR